MELWKWRIMQRENIGNEELWKKRRGTQNNYRKEI